MTASENGSVGPLLRLSSVSKVFITDDIETHALAGVHLEVERGEYVAIAGPSGCGKSTLLSILGLLDTPTDGEYWFNGRRVESLERPKGRAFVIAKWGSSFRASI
jgi:putative ABC transport system ATP-binding protein